MKTITVHYQLSSLSNRSSGNDLNHKSLQNPKSTQNILCDRQLRPKKVKQSIAAKQIKSESIKTSRKIRATKKSLHLDQVSSSKSPLPQPVRILRSNSSISSNQNLHLSSRKFSENEANSIMEDITENTQGSENSTESTVPFAGDVNSCEIVQPQDEAMIEFYADDTDTDYTEGLIATAQNNRSFERNKRSEAEAERAANRLERHIHTVISSESSNEINLDASFGAVRSTAKKRRRRTSSVCRSFVGQRPVDIYAKLLSNNNVKVTAPTVLAGHVINLQAQLDSFCDQRVEDHSVVSINQESERELSFVGSRSSDISAHAHTLSFRKKCAVSSMAGSSSVVSAHAHTHALRNKREKWPVTPVAGSSSVVSAHAHTQSVRNNRGKCSVSFVERSSSVVKKNSQTLPKRNGRTKRTVIPVERNCAVVSEHAHTLSLRNNSAKFPVRRGFQNLDAFPSTKNLIGVDVLESLRLKIRFTRGQLRKITEVVNTICTEIMDKLRENASRPFGMYTYRELERVLRAENLIGCNEFSLKKTMCASWTLKQMRRAKGILYPYSRDPNQDTL